MSRLEKYLAETVFIPSTVGFLIKDDKVLLGLRKKVSFGLGENLISGIGGKVDNDETDDEALIREMREEISIDVTGFEQVGRVRFMFPDKPKWSHSVAIYIVNKWEGEPTETVEIKPIWFNKSSLPGDQMWDDSSLWVPKVLDGEKLNGLFLYENGKVIAHRLDKIK